jgi:hypothetical protein
LVPDINDFPEITGRRSTNLNLPPPGPSRREQLEAQLNPRSKHPTRDKIIQAIIDLAPIGIGAAFGGEEGATGAAQATERNITVRQALAEHRRDQLKQSIEAERQREARAEEEGNQRVFQMRQQQEREAGETTRERERTAAAGELRKSVMAQQAEFERQRQIDRAEDNSRLERSLRESVRHHTAIENKPPAPRELPQGSEFERAFKLEHGRMPTTQDIIDYQTGKAHALAQEKERGTVSSKLSDAEFRVSQMEDAYKRAEAGETQADVSLLFNHIGMTLSAQKGARITMAEIERAAKTRTLPEEFQVQYDWLVGKGSRRSLAHEQRQQMLNLARSQRDMYRKRAGELGEGGGQTESDIVKIATDKDGNRKGYSRSKKAWVDLPKQ